jgi:hypothetical protein
LDLPDELVNNLKRHGVSPQSLKDMTPARLRAVLEQHKEISKDLIDKVLAPQVNTRGRNILVISLSLIVLAAVLGVLFLWKPETKRDSANIANSQNTQIAQGGAN